MEQNKKTLVITNDLLEEIEEAMDGNDFGNEWYLDIDKNAVVLLSDFESDQGTFDLVENDKKGRFIPIKSQFPSEGWNQMEQFILSLDDLDDKKREYLLLSIKGRGAFRRFRDAVWNLGIRDQWFEFRDRERRKEVMNWLLSIDLITDEDVERGMSFYEETLALRTQYQTDLANMKKGVCVRCKFNKGYARQLTVGKIYDVLDEQKENLNVHIKDDLDNIRWFPKSHFELLK